MSLKRYAFSLLELLVVIMIISVSYFLTFSVMQDEASEPKALTPLTLKSTLLEQNLTTGEQEFFCVNKCQACFLHQDGVVIEYDGKVALDKIIVHKVDTDDNLYEVDFGRYKDHPICLRFGLHQNGSSSQMIIEQNRRFYYLPAFFANAVEVDSLDEAKKLWIEPTRMLTSSGDYY
jgi:prepilin-type N-terminal cleavage/methylation domain-containing protein